MASLIIIAAGPDPHAIPKPSLPWPDMMRYKAVLPAIRPQSRGPKTARPAAIMVDPPQTAVRGGGLPPIRMVKGGKGQNTLDKSWYAASCRHATLQRDLRAGGGVYRKCGGVKSDRVACHQSGSPAAAAAAGTNPCFAGSGARTAPTGPPEWTYRARTKSRPCCEICPTPGGANSPFPPPGFNKYYRPASCLSRPYPPTPK